MKFFVVLVDGEAVSYHLTLEGAQKRAVKWIADDDDQDGMRRWHASVDGGILILLEKQIWE
jgi:hypothetical protein